MKMRVSVIDDCTFGHLYEYDQVVPLPAIDDTIDHEGSSRTYTVQSVRLCYLRDVIEATITATLRAEP
ncbi:MAG TPA: hypothetical protein VK638_00835 [Edaphobacter sp.]|nr:hypothetical protein [Edaphobacter sp.]